MLLLGHMVTAVGAVALLRGALSRFPSGVPSATNSEADTGAHQTNPPSLRMRWLNMTKELDMRLLLLGSLLPDIIDKPVGLYFFRDTFGSGRIFSHTLLFSFLISLTGVYLYQKHSKTWVLILAIGMLTHLIGDGMWLVPQTFFWPAYGWSFPRIASTSWFQLILHNVRTNPAVFVPEILGALALLWFVVAQRRKLRIFIRTARV